MTGDKNLGFPNYFVAQKARARIHQQDEKLGKKLFFGTGEKAAKKKPKKSTKKQSRRQRDSSMSDSDEGAYESQDQSEAENELTQFTREAVKVEDMYEPSIPEKHD